MNFRNTIYPCVSAMEETEATLPVKFPDYPESDTQISSVISELRLLKPEWKVGEKCRILCEEEDFEEKRRVKYDFGKTPFSRGFTQIPRTFRTGFRKDPTKFRQIPPKFRTGFRESCLNGEITWQTSLLIPTWWLRVLRPSIGTASPQHREK